MTGCLDLLSAGSDITLHLFIILTHWLVTSYWVITAVRM